MNIIDLQERLKDMPEQALMQEMQMPTGTAPQFLVLGELKRRKRMRDDYQRMQASDMKTVAEEAVTAAGVPQAGIMGVSQAMAPRSAIAQNTGVNDMMEREATRAPQPEQPMMMADGGVLKMQPGGDVRQDVLNFLDRNRLRGGFGDNVEYDYKAFLEEMGLRDTPDARDTFRRYQERMNTSYALEGPNTDPTLFMRGLDRAPEGISIADVSTDLNAFLPGAESRAPRIMAPPSLGIADVSTDLNAFLPGTDFRAPRMMEPPSLGAAPSMDTVDFDASITEAPAAPPPLPDTLAGSDLIRAAAEFSGPSEASRAALAAQPAPTYGPNIGLMEALQAEQDAQKVETPDMVDPRVVTQGERPEFVGDVIDYLRGLGSDAPSQIGGYEFSPEELAAMDEQQAADVSGMDELARQSAEEAARLREEMGITDSRESIGAGIVEGDQEKIDRILDVARNALPVGMDTGTPLQVPKEGIGALLPPRRAPKVSSTSTTKTTSTTSASSGYGSIESRIAKMLADREKSAEADKWLALAQTGLALMASSQPTIGGAIGEAGLAGIGAMQKARSQYDEDIIDLLNMQAGIQKAKAAGARAARTGGLTASNIVSLLNNAVDERNRIAIELAKMTPDIVTGKLPPESDILRRMLVDTELQIREYNGLLNGRGGAAGVSSGVDFDATAS